MKIAIVGADGSKWTLGQQMKARLEIAKILTDAIITKFPNRKRISTEELKQIVLVSGHCHKGGVDIWAEEIADEMEIAKEIYPAEVHQWKNKYEERKLWGLTKYRFKKLKGYCSRNIQIAEACDILYDIEPKGSCRYCGGTGMSHVSSATRDTDVCPKCKGTGSHSGGTFTMYETEKLGKEVHQIIIE